MVRRWRRWRRNIIIKERGRGSMLSIFSNAVLNVPGVRDFTVGPTPRAVLTRATLAYVISAAQETESNGIATRGQRIAALTKIFVAAIPASATAGPIVLDATVGKTIQREWVGQDGTYELQYPIFPGNQHLAGVIIIYEIPSLIQSFRTGRFLRTLIAS
jgi:hypothetical protein